jgi:hypothetical protein
VVGTSRPGKLCPHVKPGTRYQKRQSDTPAPSKHHASTNVNLAGAVPHQLGTVGKLNGPQHQTGPTTPAVIVTELLRYRHRIDKTSAPAPRSSRLRCINAVFNALLLTLLCELVNGPARHGGIGAPDAGQREAGTMARKVREEARTSDSYGILVLDASYKQTLVSTRSLGRAGLSVALGECFAECDQSLPAGSIGPTRWRRLARLCVLLQAS